ncbi:MAG: DNA helicase RecQ [Flavobacteriales bacterium]
MKNQAQTILKTTFGYDTFRPFQEEIIHRTLEGKDSFVLMPTGGGKSMCFQIPALILDGLSLVVSPLISLMKDQVQALQSHGIKADFFNSSISPEEELEVISRAKNGELKLLYLSPEKLISLKDSWIRELKINLVAVDEAHCVSMWGHDFRPEYTQLKAFRQSLPHIPFMALTATADKSARQDIENQLGLIDSKLFISSFDRKNLSIEVRGQVPKKKKLEEISSFIKQKPGESGIIYCLSRKNTEEVAAHLISEGFDAAYYHAGIQSFDRSTIQTKFINDDLKIIVATIAFGMGIDKSNVRWVIHYNLPKNLEGYYQEIGRSGRDGLPSETLLYYNMRDFVLYSQFAEDGAHTEMQKDKLNRMLQFAEAKSCRRRILLSYFGEHLEENCGNCDVCHQPPQVFDGTVLAQKALSAIVRMKETEGITMLINVLRGSNNADIHDKEYFKLKTYGLGKGVSYNDWRDYVIQFANQGLIEIMYSERSALKITPLGWEVLKGQKLIKLTKPLTPDEKKMEVVAKKKASKKTKNSGLLEDLKALRLSIAKQKGVPAFVIFNDKTLVDMANQLPTTNQEFLDISGVGENKAKQYGKAFMDLIIAFKSKPKPKTQNTHTSYKSFELYKEGLSPQQIAEKRGFTLGTIFSHLVRLYDEGEAIDLEQFVSSETVQKVKIVYEELSRVKELKPIFDKLEESVSYDDIRLSISIINRNQNK